MKTHERETVTHEFKTEAQAVAFFDELRGFLPRHTGYSKPLMSMDNNLVVNASSMARIYELRGVYYVDVMPAPQRPIEPPTRSTNFYGGF